jgi:hypothetical protein
MRLYSLRPRPPFCGRGFFTKAFETRAAPLSGVPAGVGAPRLTKYYFTLEKIDAF